MGVVYEKVDDLREFHEAADEDARRNQLRFRDLIKVGFATKEQDLDVGKTRLQGSYGRHYTLFYINVFRFTLFRHYSEH